MNDGLKQFKRMAERARDDRSPVVDISDAVLTRIRGVQLADSDVNRMLAWCGSLATVAAMVHPRECDAVGSGPLLCHVPLTLTVDNAGSAGGGTVIITWR